MVSNSFSRRISHCGIAPIRLNFHTSLAKILCRLLQNWLCHPEWHLLTIRFLFQLKSNVFMAMHFPTRILKRIDFTMHQVIIIRAKFKNSQYIIYFFFPIVGYSINLFLLKNELSRSTTAIMLNVKDLNTILTR